jgi:hypothetical protein
MTDADGNTLAESGGSAPAAAPPSPSSPSSERIERQQHIDRARVAHGDLERAAGSLIEPDDGGPVDLDKPAYEATDARAKLSRLADIAEQSDPQEPPAPSRIEPPKSWSKEDRAVFERLEPELQARIAAREAQREGHWNQQRQEVDRLRHQTETELQQRYGTELERVRAAEQLARLPVEAILQTQLRETALNEFRSRYPDVNETTNIDQYHQQLLAQGEADRAAQFAADVPALAAIVEGAERTVFQAQKAAEQQQAEAQRARGEQLKQFQASQDAEFARRNPEFADERKAAEIRERVVVPYLRDGLKLPPERIAHLWDHEPLFRTVEAQQMLLDAAQWRAAQQAARNAAPVAPRRPQSGGVNQGYVRGDELAAAAERGNMERYVALRNGSGRSR